MQLHRFLPIPPWKPPTSKHGFVYLFNGQPNAYRPTVLTLLAERRKPSGECSVNAAKPEGSRPAATESQSIVSANSVPAPLECG